MLLVMFMISVLIFRLMVICSDFSVIDCSVMLLCLLGWMNCGRSDRYIIVIFGFNRLVSSFIVNRCGGWLGDSVCIWNGEWLLGCSVC